MTFKTVESIEHKSDLYNILKCLELVFIGIGFNLSVSRRDISLDYSKDAAILYPTAERNFDFPLIASDSKNKVVVVKLSFDIFIGRMVIKNRSINVNFILRSINRFLLVEKM